jgi:hypothetical protein
LARFKPELALCVIKKPGFKIKLNLNLGVAPKGIFDRINGLTGFLIH